MAFSLFRLTHFTFYISDGFFTFWNQYSKHRDPGHAGFCVGQFFSSTGISLAQQMTTSKIVVF
jgi:hypothetical protein